MYGYNCEGDSLYFVCPGNGI